MNRRKFFSLFTAAIAAVPFLRRWFKPKPIVDNEKRVLVEYASKGGTWEKITGWGGDRHATHKLSNIDGVTHYYEWMPESSVWRELEKDETGNWLI